MAGKLSTTGSCPVNTVHIDPQGSPCWLPTIAVFTCSGYRGGRACPPGCLEQIKTARQDGLTTAPTFFRELNAFLIMLKFSDSYETYRICSQQYLQSIWIVFGCMGCWGVGWGVPNPSRRIHDGFTTDQDWPGQTHLSVCNWMMLEYSDSYETYRICSQQYLHTLLIENPNVPLTCLYYVIYRNCAVLPYSAEVCTYMYWEAYITV